MLGVEAHPIEVEVALVLGLGQFTIVGLPDGAIRESRERIAAVLANSGDSFPIRRITNLRLPAKLRIRWDFAASQLFGVRLAWSAKPMRRNRKR